MEDGVGPRHVVVLPQPPRPHAEPRLETARPRLWCFAGGREGPRPRERTAGRTFHLLTGPVLVVRVLLLVELSQPVRLLHEGFPRLVVQSLPPEKYFMSKVWSEMLGLVRVLGGWRASASNLARHLYYKT